ncbi:bacillithiol transferase BstA [Staphylococcus sp. SQ8-PEA]|uniref:Bacillithiol transferase BstA n=1 Tax=Staphylococcus marylandisciuri TaxID=2981529 RepID=A0ABT2QQB9_9STAP|nr:bacillithiol transferase BstA [Staphylococcus marylandisciuri]MCU5746171.1 bacillithiol transferase BstA [Staphylococcus marylandisciuri]
MPRDTLIDAIDFGIDHLIKGYEQWNVASVLDKESDYFPNNLHWQYGHLLTVFEFALSTVEQNEVDIALYNNLFGYGTKPADWGDVEVPDIEEIFKHIKTLPERVRNLESQQLETELQEPIVGCETLGELLVLNACHVPLHNGKIEEMTRVLKQI